MLYKNGRLNLHLATGLIHQQIFEQSDVLANRSQNVWDCQSKDCQRVLRKLTLNLDPKKKEVIPEKLKVIIGLILEFDDAACDFLNEYNSFSTFLRLLLMQSTGSLKGIDVPQARPLFERITPDSLSSGKKSKLSSIFSRNTKWK